MDVIGKAYVTHGGEHLLLIWWQFGFVIHHLINQFRYVFVEKLLVKW